MNWENTFKTLPDVEKKALIQKAYETGFSYEGRFGNCAQCTLAAIGDIFGCGNDEVFKAAYNFAGGYGLTSKGTCGAVSATAMLISSIHGRDREHFETGGRYAHSYKLARRFLDRFNELYGSGICCEVHKKIFDGRSFDLSNREQYMAFEAAGGHVDKCTAVVGNACKILAEMIVNGEM